MSDQPRPSQPKRPRVLTQKKIYLIDEEIDAEIEFEDSGSEFYPTDYDSSESDSDIDEDRPQIFMSQITKINIYENASNENNEEPRVAANIGLTPSLRNRTEVK